MSEREKEILEKIAEALPVMSERSKGEMIGYARAMVDIKQGVEGGGKKGKEEGHE